MKARLNQVISISALVLAIAALGVGLWSSAWAQEGSPEAVNAIPTTLNYQGLLREPDGSLTNGTYKITARIYDQAAGGSLKYETILPVVNVRDGLFNIVLGDSPPMPDTVFANAPLYIGITVNEQSELIPRQRLHAVPWAFQASTLVNNAIAQTVQGLTSTGNLTVSGETTLNGGTTLNGNATVGGVTTLNGNATVGGITTLNGNATVGGSLFVTGDLAHPGETFVGPHFLDTWFEFKSGSGCPPTAPTWTDVDASAHIPAGATAVILEYVTKIDDGWASIQIRKSAVSSQEYTLAWSRAEGIADFIGDGGQGTFPVDGDRKFQYQIIGTPNGYNSFCRLDLIGYYK